VPDVVLLGPAGCGKSALTGALAHKLRRHHRVLTVNLDPGVLRLPYLPDYDVRDIVTIPRLMREEGLGPNGALVRAMEIIVRRLRVPKRGHTYRIVDTPGQLEIFAFTPYGPAILRKLENPIAVFIIDGTLRPRDLPVFYLLALATRIRLAVPTILVVNKADLLDDRERKRLLNYLTNPKLLKRIRVSGLIADMYHEVCDLLATLVPAQRIPLVSAITGEGLDELCDLLHEVYCVCGDLT